MTDEHRVEKKVLVVEDEQTVREYVLFCLQKNGYAAHVTESAEEAADYFYSATQEILLVMADINLPGKSGLKLLEEIRWYAPDMPFIIMSADASLEKDMDYTDCMFLKKPCSCAVIKAAVHKMAGR